MLKDVLFKNRNKFNLQLFAEGDGSDNSNADDNANVPADNDNADNGGQKKNEPERKYTDADVDKIVARVIAKERERANKQVDEERAKVSEAERLGKMSAEEKANERIKALENRLAEADRRDAIAAMTKTARAIFQEENINIGDELLANLVTDNADDTKAAVTGFIKLFKAEVEKAVKAAYKGTTPKSGGSPAAMTKEQAEAKLKSLTNPKERRDFIQQNMDLFKN